MHVSLPFQDMCTMGPAKPDQVHVQTCFTNFRLKAKPCLLSWGSGERLFFERCVNLWRYLPIALMSCLVCLAQVEAHPVCMLLVQLLHQVQRTLAQRLTNGVKENKDQVSKVT